MDIGCLDLCSISVESNEKSSLDFDSKLNDVADPLSTSSKIRKIKNSKEAVQSTLSTSLNKLTSQIKKPPHRKTSPVNWFPRKKGDSYLERKIKMLQEISGMNSTLDETLGDSNPHYCRVLREKMAAKEAAYRVLEARKAALVEASWCRILKAARIQNKEAEAQLLQASKTATEAFEAATAKGVIMYDTPNCPKKLGQIHTSSIGGTYAVTASFETAFEVDKEVAEAVKTALTKLANCPSSFSKDEIKELLRKISQNPDTDQNNEELSEFLSETGSSDLETVSQKDGFIIASQDLKCKKIPVLDTKLRENRRRKSLEKLNMTKIVDMMLVRLQSLQEDELSSIATTVATCGLNAALAQVESNKLHQPAPNFSRRISSLGAGRKNTNTELPSLDKFLVKHMTKLEREVQEAKNSRKNEPKEETNEEKENSEEISKMEKKNQKGRNSSSSESFIDLGSMFVKHSSKLEKEIEDAKMKNVKGLDGVTNQQVIHLKEDDVKGLPSLDKFLVKHVSKLEKEVQEAKNKRKNVGNTQQSKRAEANDASSDTLEKILVKPVHMLQREKMQASANEYQYKNIQRKKQGGEEGVTTECESLDKVLVKHVSRLEKEKMRKLGSKEEEEWKGIIQRKKQGGEGTTECESLDKVLVKHVSRLEKEKMRKLGSKEEEEWKGIIQRKKQGGEGTTECEGLDKVLVKHVSRLEKEKMRKLGSKEEEEWKGIIQRKKQGGEGTTECESLDKVLVKHVSRLEKEKMRKLGSKEEEEWKGIIQRKKQGGEGTTECESLDKVLVKHVSRLEKEKMRKLGSKEEEEWKEIIQRKRQGGEGTTECESLDKVLVKHVSRLEKEKMRIGSKVEEDWKEIKRYKENKNLQMEQVGGGLEQILVKHKSKLEKEKMDANQELNEETKASVSRKEARERELQETWGGLGLGNSMRPHVSKLEKDKAAWIKAEKEGKQGAALPD